jgi:hypothetical protein
MRGFFAPEKQQEKYGSSTRTSVMLSTGSVLRPAERRIA